MDKTSILSIEPTKAKYRQCNVCGEEIDERTRRHSLVDDNEIHELQFGRNKHAVSICLCTKCLNEFADMLWNYL